MAVLLFLLLYQNPKPLPVLVPQVGHAGLVTSVAFSPDGKMLASGSFDETVKIWDSTSGEVIHTLNGHSSWVWSVAFSPDGKMLASSSSDNTVKIWDSTSGDLIRTLKDHSDSVRLVAFSPDGKTLASGSVDKTIKIWDSMSGRLIRTLKGHSHSVNSVAFSPDGKTLSSGSGDKTVKIWEILSGSVIHTLEGHSDSVWSVAFSPDGKTLASGSYDNTVKIWEIPNGRLISTLEGHLSGVKSVAFSPDGKTLASGGDKAVKIWEIPSGGLIRTLEGHSDSVWSVAFSPDDNTLASGSDDKTVNIWEIPSGGLIRTLEGHFDWVRSVAFSPDGKTLISTDAWGASYAWDLASGKNLGKVNQPITTKSQRTGLHATLVGGTISILKGKHLLARLIAFGNKGWLCFTPEGYYDGSAEGINHIRWREGLMLHPVATYAKQFHRPDLVRLKLAGPKVSFRWGWVLSGLFLLMGFVIWLKWRAKMANPNQSDDQKSLGTYIPGHQIPPPKLAKSQPEVPEVGRPQAATQDVAATNTETPNAAVPISSPQQPVAPKAEPAAPARKELFVSYSRKDKEWLARFETHLAALDHQVTLWSDERILPGEQWHEQITDALSRAQMAILLVSSDFIASDFIKKQEIPKLLERNQAEGLVIYWVHLRPCFWKNQPFAKFQAIYPPDTALAELKKVDQDKAFAKIINELHKALQAGPSGPTAK